MKDYEAAEKAARAVGSAVQDAGGPLGLVGRVVGFGEDEIRAGVPRWAWFGIGFVVGGVVMYSLHDKAKALVEA